MIAFVVALAFAVLIIPAACVALWVGHGELHVVTTVVSRNSSETITDAVLIVSEPESGVRREFRTSSRGRTVIVEQRTTSGKKSWYVDTATISLPYWTVRAEADGFEDSKPVMVYNRAQPPRPASGEPWVLEIETSIEPSKAESLTTP